MRGMEPLLLVIGWIVRLNWFRNAGRYHGPRPYDKDLCSRRPLQASRSGTGMLTTSWSGDDKTDCWSLYLAANRAFQITLIYSYPI